MKTVFKENKSSSRGKSSLPSQLPPWFIMKTAWHFQVDFTTQLFINAKLIYMMLALWNPDDMCYEVQEPVFIYSMKMLDSSTCLSVGTLLKSKQSDLIIQQQGTHQPHSKVYLVNIGANGRSRGWWPVPATLNLTSINSLDAPQLNMKGLHFCRNLSL